jgi:hypothetical protein
VGRSSIGHREAIGFSCVLLAASLIWSYSSRKTLFTTAYNRRLFGALLVALTAITLDRVLHAVLRRPVHQIFMVDFLLLAVVTATAALSLGRWIGWVALIYAAGAIAAAFAGERAALLFPIVNLVAIGLGVYWMRGLGRTQTPP